MVWRRQSSFLSVVMSLSLVICIVETFECWVSKCAVYGCESDAFFLPPQSHQDNVVGGCEDGC
jgi:hypothetical protein